MQISELSDLYQNLPPLPRKLVVLYARAHLLKQEMSRPSTRHRLALLKEIFDPAPVELLPPPPARVTREHAIFIDEVLGVSVDWILDGNTDALAVRILEFCRQGGGCH